MKIARATVHQRAELARVEKLLREAYDSLDSRFFATDPQRKSYEEVLRHLAVWLEWERSLDID